MTPETATCMVGGHAPNCRCQETKTPIRTSDNEDAVRAVYPLALEGKIAPPSGPRYYIIFDRSLGDQVLGEGFSWDLAWADARQRVEAASGPGITVTYLGDGPTEVALGD